MADKNPLTTWLLSHRIILNPHFTEFEWPSHILPGLSDFATKITFRNFIFEGRGIDNNPLIALEKSVSEALERCVWRQLGLSFNGFSLSNPQISNSHAMLEALERYFLHIHLSKKISFERIEKVENFQNLIFNFNKYNPTDKIDFFKMSIANPNFGVVCRIQTSEGCIFPGFSLAPSLEQSLFKSFYESITNFAWHKKNNSMKSYLNKPWHLNEKFILSLNPLLQNGIQNTQLIETPELECHSVNLSCIPELSTCPATAIGYNIKGFGEIKWS